YRNFDIPALAVVLDPLVINDSDSFSICGHRTALRKILVTFCARERKFIQSDSSPKRAGIEDRASARVIMCCTWLEYQPTGSRRSQWRGGTMHRRRQAEAPSHGTGGECALDAAELRGAIQRRGHRPVRT